MKLRRPNIIELDAGDEVDAVITDAAHDARIVGLEDKAMHEIKRLGLAQSRVKAVFLLEPDFVPADVRDSQLFVAFGELDALHLALNPVQPGVFAVLEPCRGE